MADREDRNLNDDALDEIYGAESDHKPNEAEKRLREDIHATFGSERGERVLAWMRATFHDQLSFDPQLPQPHSTFFNEGQRQVYLTIQQILDQIERGEA